MKRNKKPRSGKCEIYTVHIALSPELGKALEIAAKQDDRSVSSLARKLLQEALRKMEQDQK
jgi:hypothetical protein